MKNYADKSRVASSVKVGDLVLLSTQNLDLKGTKSKKLRPRYIGPYKVVK